MSAERVTSTRVFAVLAIALSAGCGGGEIDQSNLDDFPPQAGTTPGAPCRAADDPAGPCDQDLSGADFVDMVCLAGTCVVDCAEGGDFLCSTVVAPFLTCSEAAGSVCVPACDDNLACEVGSSCFVDDDACLPTGSFPTSPCRDASDPAGPCDPVGGAAMSCTSAGVCAVDCGVGGDPVCRGVDPALKCSGAAGDVCVYDCAAGCPSGYSCFGSEGTCLPTGDFPGSPCLVANVGDAPSCGAVGGVAMSCVADLCVVPCTGAEGDDALCAGVDPTLGCSAAAGACVPTCADGLCPDGFSCFANEERCLPTGSFPTSPCDADSPCGSLPGPGDVAVPMRCTSDQCVVPCAALGGDALCQAVDASLGCSETADGCLPVCVDGACDAGFSCFSEEDRCLPTGSFPGSPCRSGDDACDQDLLGHPDVDMVCSLGSCVVDCAAGGDYVCGQVDPSLACSAAAGDVCLPRCDGDGGCPEGLSCFDSEGTCLPSGSFPGSPCASVGGAGCAALAGLGDMACAQPDPDGGPVCLLDCSTGGTGLCQQLDPGLSCYAQPGSPSLCLPNGTFPGSLCRDPVTLAAGEPLCDRDLQGQADVDLACVAGTCQLGCTAGGDTLCGLIGAGMGLPVGALTCVDAGGAGAFCARAGCASGGSSCAADHHCDPALDACLPYQPLTIVHTNDLGSHFDGVGPAGAAPVGGFPRLAAVVREKQQRANAHGAVLLTLDGGGFSQGTLFALLQGTVEMELLRYLDYDAAALGAHELDWGPASFAAALARDTGPAPILPNVISAVLGCTVGQSGCPALSPVPIVASNLRFDSIDPGDDALAALYDTGGGASVADAPLRRFVVVERGGLKIGVLSVLSPDLAELAPGKAPLTFADPIEVARALVDEVRSPPWNADVVVALSHAPPSRPPYLGQDEILAAEVHGIDVIVGGGGSALAPVQRVGSAWIVRAASAGRSVGELEIAWPLTPYGPAAGRVDGVIGGVAPTDVVAGIAPDQVLAAARSTYVAQIDAGFASTGLAYAGAVGLIERDYTAMALGESLLGDLVADAVRERATLAVASSADPSAIEVALVANATLGDPLAMNPTADPTTVKLADVFAAVPYGASPTAPSLPGWPIVEMYVSGDDLRHALEVGPTLGPLRGAAFWLNVSGVRVEYDRDRPPFHRITGIWLDPDGDADVCSQAGNLLNPDGTVKDGSERYRVAGNLLLAGLLAKLDALTEGALTVVPRSSGGTPTDPAARPAPGGVWGGQLREWQALVDHIHALTVQQNDGPIPPPLGQRWLDPAARASACAR